MGSRGDIKMVKYELRIEKQQIFGAEKIAIAANANETVSLHFCFDSSWRIFDAKAAIFRTAQNKYYIMEIKSSSVTVPWEVLCVDRDFELSVIGYDGAKVLTAGKVDVRVVSSLLPEDCKTLSPTETLFDRFRQDSISEAYRKYEDEIDSLKRSYEKKIVELGNQISKANDNTENVEKTKNEEIKKLKQDHAAEVHSLNTKIEEINKTLAAAKIKANNWDLVDAAMSDKTRSNFAPWTGGTKEYKLPFFNTKNMQYLSTGNFDGHVSEIGLDLSSATSLDEMFRLKECLKKVELRNTDKLTTMVNAFSNSVALREVTLGNLTQCTSAKWAFFDDTSLERVTLGKNGIINNFFATFSGCISLKEIIGDLNLIAAITVQGMFENCTSLQTVSFVKETIGIDINFGSCKSLSKESMMSIFDGVVKNGERDLTLSRYAFENNFPTAAEQNEIINALTKKNWSLNLA